MSLSHLCVRSSASQQVKQEQLRDNRARPNLTEVSFYKAEESHKSLEHPRRHKHQEQRALSDNVETYIFSLAGHIDSTRQHNTEAPENMRRLDWGLGARPFKTCQSPSYFPLSHGNPATIGLLLLLLFSSSPSSPPTLFLFFSFYPPLLLLLLLSPIFSTSSSSSSSLS
ncbi:hypothetical protein Q8A73_006372 [Channa argus]|nr:hypothetical protein Q8A73_006372 [Channa argus]